MTRDATKSVLLDEIEQVTQTALERHGAAPGVAGQVAHAVRVAEGNGNRICGLYYLDSYCKQLTTGRVHGTVTPTVHHERPGAVRVDAKFGFAQAAFAAGFVVLAMPALRTPAGRTAAVLGGTIAAIATLGFRPGIPVILAAIGALGAYAIHTPRSAR